MGICSGARRLVLAVAAIAPWGLAGVARSQPASEAPCAGAATAACASALPPAPAAGVAPRARARVVIDPGHGGSNPGARGAVEGVHEKAVTLPLARRIAGALTRRGIEATLTRTDDRTLTLRQRVAEANRRAADAFVSVHANASVTRLQRGYETFVLTPTGLDVDGRALRGETGTPRPGIDPEIALVLDDVERGAAQWEAAELAAAIQARLAGVRGREGDRGVRQDAHHVLLGATMPAVLVEVGFLDHPIEGRDLVDPEVQARLAEAIA
jgi:N-acetylmuramoyl-L-alanine amidase